jgi:hypothetical protein
MLWPISIAAVVVIAGLWVFSRRSNHTVKSFDDLMAKLPNDTWSVEGRRKTVELLLSLSVNLAGVDEGAETMLRKIREGATQYLNDSGGGYTLPSMQHYTRIKQTALILCDHLHPYGQLTDRLERAL